jgi:hypothetical protein
MSDYSEKLQEIAKRIVALRDHGIAGTGGDTFEKCADDAVALFRSEVPRRRQVSMSRKLDPTVFENTAHEGWLICECDDGVLRIQKYDDDPNRRFETDAEARIYVENKASRGNLLHWRALGIVGNPPNAARLLSTVMKVVHAVRRINQELDDPHGDGSGRDSESPTGDSYNELWDCLDPLFSIVDKVLLNKTTADA